MDHVLCGPNSVKIFTEHRNLLHVFAQLALFPNSPRYVLSKVYCWAILLSRFHLVIEHIDGSRKIFADLLTRWFKRTSFNKALCVNVAAFYLDTVPSVDEGGKPLDE